jgi:predicted Fe-Mo cluster-binding NifX family protein
MMPISSSPESSALTIAGDTSGKICIATNGNDPDDDIAPMFDRAPYFLIIELGHSKVVANPNVQDRVGVGVQSAQLVVSEGATVVITNDISVKALEELNRLRIEVFTGVSGTAKQALSWYQNGRLTPSTLNDEKKEEHSGGSSGKGKDSKSSSSSSSSRAL